ncbi:hypothetical protein [Amycolatopsis sp. NPDC058986]|uniref:hypothetical protein n=1 Tax=unclassified Amycolatopsis TaxID=2618356 RepID=UPI003672755B
MPGTTTPELPDFSPHTAEPAAEHRTLVPPPQVKVSFWLLLLQAGFALGTALLTIIGMSAADAVARATDGAVSAGVAATAIGLVAVVFLVIGLLTLLIALNVREGRGWTRVVLVVVFVLALAGQVNGGQDLGGWLTVAFSFLCTCLLFAPAASAYFQAVKQRR